MEERISVKVRNYKNWIAVTALVAILFALAVVLIIKNYVQVEQVASAARDIAPDQVITKADLAIAEVVKGNLYQNAVTVEEVVGQAAKGFIPAGTVMNSAMVESGPVTISGQLAKLGENYKALAIPETLLTSVAGSVRKGDRINIYQEAVLRPGETENKKQLAQNILVLQGAYLKQENESKPQFQGLIVAVQEAEAQNIRPYLTQDQQNKLICELLPKTKEQK